MIIDNNSTLYSCTLVDSSFDTKAKPYCIKYDDITKISINEKNGQVYLLNNELEITPLGVTILDDEDKILEPNRIFLNVGRSLYFRNKIISNDRKHIIRFLKSFYIDSKVSLYKNEIKYFTLKNQTDYTRRQIEIYETKIKNIKEFYKAAINKLKEI